MLSGVSCEVEDRLSAVTTISSRPSGAAAGAGVEGFADCAFTVPETSAQVRPVAMYSAVVEFIVVAPPFLDLMLRSENSRCFCREDTGAYTVRVRSSLLPSPPCPGTGRLYDDARGLHPRILLRSESR